MSEPDIRWSAEEYRRKADEADRAAEKAPTKAFAEALRDIAQRWRVLAATADRSSQTK